ncbi:MAG: NYN domain-containing protein, partial [Gammaproteobacteria bacterium]|nr:NYN domain-containing protein [Gammaproteobacteria bacterium]
MKDLSEQKKIAVLIDGDNAQCSRMKLILDELSAHGHILTKRAYGDWSTDHLKNWKKTLNELAIQPIQQFAYTTGKNSTDASMIIDAMDLLYSGKFDAFALVSSDSDFTKLASRLRESEIFVFGVGETKTPISFRNACDDFILVENLGAELAEVKAAAPEQKDNKKVEDSSQLVPVLTKAWE